MWADITWLHARATGAILLHSVPEPEGELLMQVEGTNKQTNLAAHQLTTTTAQAEGNVNAKDLNERYSPME